MSSSDTVFAGSIPALYDRYLVPLLFEPYAEDLARRVAETGAADILETAAGTGVVTAAIRRRLAKARIVATDLNAAMLDIAAKRIGEGQAELRPADALALPFGEASFDAVVCQFGVMFFPDRIAAYREARRVLRPGGRYIFNAWDRLERNEATQVLADAVAELFPGDAPDFFRRVPFGYHDRGRIEADLRAAGFERIEAETVEKRSRIGSAREAAVGMCQGSPLRSELEARGPETLERTTEAVAAALARLEGGDGLDAAMSAHVLIAWR